MPQKIFFSCNAKCNIFWKDYTRSFPAEKTGLWKMVSENVINHAKVVQGVFEMNIWLWATELPLPHPPSFSHSCLGESRGGKNRSMEQTAPLRPQSIMHLYEKSGSQVCLISGKNTGEKNLDFYWLSAATPKENKLRIFKFLKQNLLMVLIKCCFKVGFFHISSTEQSTHFSSFLKNGGLLRHTFPQVKKSQLPRLCLLTSHWETWAVLYVLNKFLLASVYCKPLP